MSAAAWFPLRLKSAAAGVCRLQLPRLVGRFSLDAKMRSGFEGTKAGNWRRQWIMRWEVAESTESAVAWLAYAVRIQTAAAAIHCCRSRDSLRQ